MRKYIVSIGIGILLLGIVLVFSGCDTSVVPSIGQSEIPSLTKGVPVDDCLAAPAIASFLLKEAGIDNRYDGGNYIKDVANEMGPGSDFHGASRCDENYADLVAVFLIGQGAQVNILKPVYNETQNLYYDTIQEAIVDSVNGDKIFVCPGTYYEHIEFNNKNITVQSSNPSSPSIVAATVIDGGGSGSVVRFVNGDTSTLEGFTIQNGNAEYGGGIYVAESDSTITGNTITGNTSEYYGGGIYMSYSSGTITGNTISFNTVSRYGGGIAMYYSDNTIITDNDIMGNTADIRGGGIAMDYSDNTIITDNDIMGNTANDGGGGIIVYFSDPTITGNTITGNTTEYGGGIAMYYSDNTIITDNDIEYNDAVHGGGICVDGSDHLEITDNDITYNTASSDGGGIFVNSSSATITGNTITGNTATYYAGGGIYVARIYATGSDHLEITDNDITYNKASSDGGGIYVNSSSDLFPAADRSTGWGTGRENIPIGDPLVPAEGEEYTIAGNEFLGNEHGAPSDYTEGAHVYFEP